MGMTAREYLAFVARAKGVSIRDLDAQLDRVTAATGIEEVLDRLIRNLSKGFRQRVGIAQTLLGDPQVIILDEPTVGLDPLQIVEIRRLIRKLGKTHTVILSSHILSEVQAVCDRVLMIHRGKLVASGTPAELERQFAGNVIYHVTVKAEPGPARTALVYLPGASEVTAKAGEDGRTELTVSASDTGPDMDERISFALSDRRIPVLRLEREQTRLEDVFLALAQDDPDFAAGKGKKKGKGGRDK